MNSEPFNANRIALTSKLQPTTLPLRERSGTGDPFAEVVTLMETRSVSEEQS